jgi:CPA2 family monovalent cation:H+ antiporter-2
MRAVDLEDQAHTVFPLTEVAFVITVAVAFGLSLMRLRQPPLVGFILAGMIMGPTGLGFIRTNDSVTALAEMGVLVLLFFIGMELSVRAFILSLRPALIVACGQLAAALCIGGAISWFTGAGWTQAIILGFILALSSTVVAMKMLDDMGELRGEAGRITVGVLIAQDLAVVPMLILTNSLGGGDINVISLGLKMGFAVAVLGGLLWWLGRRGKLRVPFHDEVEERVELLALGSLAICFGAAAISGITGLSPAYGAFVAGIVVGNSTLRSRVIPVIEPIQSVLLVIFFLSIGLLIDLRYIFDNLILVLAATFFTVFAKTNLNVFLLRFTGYQRETALVGGLSMAQIGEFSFVLAAAGFSAGALGYDFYRLAIAVTAITLLFSPVWMSIMHRIDELATEGYSSYREALADAYADELENVEEGMWSLKVRYRAGRMALRKRKAKRRAAKAATENETGQEATEVSGTDNADNAETEEKQAGA